MLSKSDVMLFFTCNSNNDFTSGVDFSLYITYNGASPVVHREIW